jgi:hypothetical protein
MKGKSIMNILKIVQDIMVNITNFITFDLYITYCTKNIHPKRHNDLRFIFILIAIAAAIPKEVPYINLLWEISKFIFLYLILVRARLFEIIIAYAKYFIINITSILLIFIFRTLLFQDFTMQFSNDLYLNFTLIGCQLSFFIVLNIYIQSKKVTLHPAQQRFTRLLNVILLIIIAVLLTISLLLDGRIFDQETALTIVMTFLFVIILLFLLAYVKVIAILEENMQNQLQLQKAALEKDYNIHIEQNLKRIQTLRHDYKNQLIALQCYVANGQYDQFQAYMDELHVALSKSSPITTSSIALSALLNVKEEICHNDEIQFTFEQEFCDLKCSDTIFISIISNILDNAITAARKLEKGSGFISLLIFQRDSFLFIECKNNHCEHLQKSSDLYVTTKEDTLFHGYGLSSIKESVERLRGDMTITADEQTFHISARIPNY